jgi:hypothetical protein
VDFGGVVNERQVLALNLGVGRFHAGLLAFTRLRVNGINWLVRSLRAPSSGPVWTQIEPLLETAIAQLGEKDHDAVVLRFIEGRSFKEVSAALGTSEAGAKMRVNRALEKLREFFNQRDFGFSLAMFGAAISAHSVQGLNDTFPLEGSCLRLPG